MRFRLYSAHAERVLLCLFDHPNDATPSRTVELRRAEGKVWETVVEVPPGQLYGYRVSGPHEPKLGHRFNASKLLVDPWARAITGEPCPDTALFGFVLAGWPWPSWRERSSDLSFNSHDSAVPMPKCVVVDPAFDWQGDSPPRTPWEETVIYECHVKGMTRRHPQVDERLRGTYLGLAEPPVVEHLKSLGVTSVELLPVYQFARETHLMEKGLRNYWGYSPLGFFAPHAAYATGNRGEQVREFKEMVRRLHAAGLEVILDVVYNHTTEGGRLGPTLSLRGIDNRSYYRLPQRSPQSYVDVTGCGNTLDVGHDMVREMVLSSLRYWVEEMHVDGFRFDLAPALARDGDSGAFDREAAFFRELEADPVLSGLKLIAEPWDVGPAGYQLGSFPPPWAEWNDRYRDAVRRFWRGDGDAAELAARLAGSRDLFAGRGPRASINYVTCHDGFTLLDLVSYAHKHNDDNREANHDGHGDNLSRNWGWEGPADDPGVRHARDRARRNLAATLLLSRGVPMLLGGDELGRTQRGNNNAYCQDNDISWLDWSRAPEERDFCDFVRRLVALRREQAALRRGKGSEGPRFWLADGSELSVEAGRGGSERRALAMLVAATREGEGDLLLLANGSDQDVVFALPEAAAEWSVLLDTSSEDLVSGPASDFRVEAFSLRLLGRPDLRISEASSSSPPS